MIIDERVSLVRKRFICIMLVLTALMSGAFVKAEQITYGDDYLMEFGTTSKLLKDYLKDYQILMLGIQTAKGDSEISKYLQENGTFKYLEAVKTNRQVEINNLSKKFKKLDDKYGLSNSTRSDETSKKGTVGGDFSMPKDEGRVKGLVSIKDLKSAKIVRVLYVSFLKQDNDLSLRIIDMGNDCHEILNLQSYKASKKRLAVQLFVRLFMTV